MDARERNTSEAARVSRYTEFYDEQIQKAKVHPLDIKDTINYRDISKAVQAHVEASSYGLLEAMARKVATICLEPESVIQADVSIQKPGALRGADSVGVQISRS
jgi:FolB domain-containing protein